VNFREKHQERRPKDLQDISHLFLSTGVSAQRAAAPRALAVLACSDSVPWRAFAAAGLARALEAAGMDVTLLEAGRALPNAGFYFALEPSVYLRPVLDPRAVVSGSPAGSLRFHYARDPGRLPLPPREGTVPGRARIVLFAFDRTAGGGEPAIPARVHDLLCAVSVEAHAAPDDTARERRVALVTAGPDPAGAYLDALRKRFEEAFPGIPALRMQGEPSTGAPGKPDGSGGTSMPEVPPHIARRSPPSLELVGGTAAELLQRLARGRQEDR